MWCLILHVLLMFVTLSLKKIYVYFSVIALFGTKIAGVINEAMSEPQSWDCEVRARCVGKLQVA